MINHRIVLVTDNNKKIQIATIADRDLECNNQTATTKISSAIQQCSKDFILYTENEDFVFNIGKHKNDIIFPMKYGKNAPDSKSIIPAICEGANIRYIGADDYTHIICNDKYLSKMFAREFGIKSAPSILVRNDSNKNHVMSLLLRMHLPLVVKPNFGGGSTGISNNNICYQYDQAYRLALELLRLHQMPILIEEYISGEEVELILVGNKNQIFFSEEVQLLMNGKEYYENEIWGFETKKIDDSDIDFKISSFIPIEDVKKIHTLFMAFNKVEFMRVDGRFHNGEFFLIELSPDCYLGDDCAFYYAFKQRGYSLSEMFEYIIGNGLNYHRS